MLPAIFDVIIYRFPYDFDLLDWVSEVDLPAAVVLVIFLTAPGSASWLIVLV